MRGYQEVEIRQADYFFDAFAGAVPVAVELRRNAESLIDFEHPERALYVFGPEDGSLDRAVLAQCQLKLFRNPHPVHGSTAKPDSTTEKLRLLYW